MSASGRDLHALVAQRGANSNRTVRLTHTNPLLLWTPVVRLLWCSPGCPCPAIADLVVSTTRPPQQWMFAGLQFGALGTLLFVSFRDEGGFPIRLILVFGAWGFGLGSSVYGLLQYNRRRQALNADDPDPARWESPRAPMVLVAAFFLLVLTVLVYAIATRQHQPPLPWSPSLGDRSGGVQ